MFSYLEHPYQKALRSASYLIREEQTDFGFDVLLSQKHG